MERKKDFIQTTHIFDSHNTSTIPDFDLRHFAMHWQPMEFALQKLNSGQIKPIDIPYMQRPNGKPDNSDLTPQGYWKVAPKGMTGPGVTSPAKGGGFNFNPFGKK